MKKVKKDFLIIPISNIKNRYNLNEDLSRVFTNNLITKDHQKIILKLAIGDINKPYYAYELVTNEPFFFEEALLKVILNPDRNKYTKIYSESLVIDIHPEFVSYDKAKELYDEINSYGEELDYQKSVKEVLLKNKKTLFTKKRVKNR